MKKTVFRTEINLDSFVIFYSRLIDVLVAIPRLEANRINDFIKSEDHHLTTVGKFLVFDKIKQTYVPMNNNFQEFPIHQLETTILLLG
jgi:hypothetical protein